MVNARKPSHGKKRTPRPLNQQRLEEVALAYVGRFATTTSRLTIYLERKIRQQGWNDTHEPNLSTIVSTFAERGYVDDAAYADARARSLSRRGYGARRIAQDLYHAGVSSDIAARAEPSQAEKRQAAMRFARRRRFGPFGEAVDRATQEKHKAAMMRAGHSMDAITVILDAQSEDEVILWCEEWCEECGD